MTLSHWLSPDHSPLHRVDLVIVGAGISGISLAWWLRQSGWSVALLDQGETCSGASGRNAGFLTVGSVAHFGRLVQDHGMDTALQVRAWLDESLQGMASTLQSEKISCDLRRGQGLSLARTPQGLQSLESSAEQLHNAGFDVQYLAIKDLETRWALKHYQGGFAVPNEAQLHPVKALRALLGKSGAPVFSGHRIHHLEQERDGGYTVHSQHARFRASRVVLATNGFGPSLHPWLQGKIIPRRGQALITEPVAPLWKDIFYGTEDWAYFRQTPNGRIVLGGRRILDPEGEVGTEDKLNPIIQKDLERYLRHHLRQDIRVERRWSGPLGYTLDDLPLVGQIPEAGELYTLGGYSGHGMAWGFVCAKWMAELLQKGQEPPALMRASRCGK